MQFRGMGKYNEKPSLLGFGCMRFPTIEENGKTRINEAEAEKMMERAIKGGVNYFDTAYGYHDGESEWVLGRFMKKRKREDFFIATKLPMWEVKKKEDVSRLLETQLDKLQMDYVDYYLLHALNQDRWKLTKELGILDILERYREKGRIRNIGFSFHDGFDVFHEIIHARKWDFCQIQLNYMDTEEQAGLKGYHLATKLQIPVIVMEPVKGGSLVNFADDVKKVFADCRPEWSVASWAIRWVASLPNVRVLLSGMSTMEQVEDNLKTMEEFAPLSEGEYKVLEKAIQIIKTRVKNGCTGCAYCVPCPEGVDIPKCFYVWNQYEMYQNKGIISWEYFNVMEEGKRADKCIECGACEKLCPQRLSIRRDLKTLSDDINRIFNKN